MNIEQLKKVCLNKGLDISGCVTREDYIKLLEEKAPCTDTTIAVGTAAGDDGATLDDDDSDYDIEVNPEE